MKDKKGFTLAELLIVVAIIGVLVAVSIPIFTNQLRKARFATNVANARSAYAATMAAFMTEGPPDPGFTFAGRYEIATGILDTETTTNAGFVVDATVKGQPSSWSIDDSDLEKLCTTTDVKWICVHLNANGEVISYNFGIFN